MVTVVKGKGASTAYSTSSNEQIGSNNSLTYGEDTKPIVAGRDLGSFLAGPIDATFRLPASPRKPLQNYLIDEIPTSTKNALTDWVEKVLVNHYLSSPRSDVIRNLSVFNTLFHERNKVFNNEVRDEALIAMRALLKTVIPVLQNSTELGLINLARAFGGIGLIPHY